MEVEGERGEKCWKNVDAVAGSSALHSGDSSMIASMLLSIQPCSSEVRGSGVSGEVYGTRAAADATAAMEPRKAAGDVWSADVSPKPP